MKTVLFLLLILIASSSARGPQRAFDRFTIDERLLVSRIARSMEDYDRFRGKYKELKEYREILEFRAYKEFLNYWVFTRKFGDPRSVHVENLLLNYAKKLFESASFVHIVSSPKSFSAPHTGEFFGFSYVRVRDDGEVDRYEVKTIDEFEKMKKEFLRFLEGKG